MNLPKPTETELEILHILWHSGPCTVREVNEALSIKRAKEVGYTNTLKMMQVMHEKKILKRDASKRSHIYEAAISEEATQKSLFNRVLDHVFGGSAKKLVMQALGHKKTSAEDLAEIRKMIDQLEKDKDA